MATGNVDFDTGNIPGAKVSEYIVTVKTSGVKVSDYFDAWNTHRIKSGRYSAAVVANNAKAEAYDGVVRLYVANAPQEPALCLAPEGLNVNSRGGNPRSPPIRRPPRPERAAPTAAGQFDPCGGGASFERPPVGCTHGYSRSSPPGWLLPASDQC